MDSLVSAKNSFRQKILAILLMTLVAGTFAQDRIGELEAKLKANPDDQSMLMELGRAYYDLVASGDEGAVDKGFRCFDRLLALDSTNAVALVYRGSLWTQRARESRWPPTKLKNLKRGGDEMDRAVEMAPDNITIRLVRGINCLGLPQYANRLSEALEDFLVILKHPDFPDQTKELKALVFFYGGVAMKRADDYEKARELFKRAIAILPDSDFARRAQQELSDMGS